MKIEIEEKVEIKRSYKVTKTDALASLYTAIRINDKTQQNLFKYRQVALGEIQRDRLILSNEEFWVEIERLKKEVAKYLKLGREDGVKDGCWEFFRKPIFSKTEDPNQATFEWMKCYQFYLNYNEITQELQGSLWSNPKVSGYNDDSYGDLCDAIPLRWSRKKVEEALNGQIKGKLQYLGEKYVGSNLRRSSETALDMVVRNLYNSEED